MARNRSKNVYFANFTLALGACLSLGIVFCMVHVVASSRNLTMEEKEDAQKRLRLIWA